MFKVYVGAASEPMLVCCELAATAFSTQVMEMLHVTGAAVTVGVQIIVA
jgi:hypothetical protein